MSKWVVLFTILVHLIAAQETKEVDRLLKDKLANYNKNLRPVLYHSQPVYVTVGLELISVKEFEEVNEKITVIVVHQLHWLDPNFAWNTSDYGGAEMIRINESEVWKPTLILVNTFDKLEEVGGSSFIMRFNNTGLASWYPGSVLSATCPVDTTYYPWDTQTCNFTFVSWAFSPTEIQLAVLADTIGTTYYTPSGIWDMVGSQVYSELQGAQLTFTLKLKRKPRFIMMNVILPIVFMSFLNVVAFLIPTGSGERVSYCITVLLSIAVFLTIVGDNLPKTSNPMSILSYYLISVLGISVGITLATIFSLRMYFHAEQERVPAFWIGFARVFRCRWRSSSRHKLACARSRSSKHGDACVVGASKDASSVDTYNKTNSHVTHRCIWDKRRNYQVDIKSINGGNCNNVSTRNLSRNAIIISGQDRTFNEPAFDKGHVTWKDVSVAFDNVCFLLVLMLTIIGSMWCSITLTRNA